MAIENIEVDDYDPLAPSVSVVAYTGGEEVGAVNLGAGTQLFKRKDGATLEYRTLQAGDGVSITQGEETLLFSFDASDLDLDELEFGSTDNLAEGNVNFWFTEERARDAISIASDSNPALVYRPSSGEISLVGDIYTKADFDADFATKDTADLVESPTATLTNGQMYFTQARARQSISGTGDVVYNPTSGEISVNTYKTANFNVDLGTKTTDDLTQGTSNLYYSDTRVQGYLNSQGYQTQNSADVRYIQQSHPVNGITAQDITDWNSLVSQQVIVPWADITSKPAWVVGTSASNNDTLVWSGTEWTPTAQPTIPTDVADLTDNSNLLIEADPDWADIINKPTVFTPSAHTHIIGEITGLQTELNSKAELNHTHTNLPISATTGLQAALDGRALLNHTHVIADVSGLQQALDTKIDDETLTTLSLNANILTYTDENGGDTNIDLSVYIDDTNLARIVNGTYDGNTQLMTFTRDDNSTFTMNVAALSQIQTLEELTDTAINNPQDGTVLTYNNNTGFWQPQTPSYFSGDWADLDNVPMTFTATAHTHTIAEVDTLQAALDAKSAVGHTHTLAEVGDGVDTLATLLDDKSDVVHAHIAADITDFVSTVQDVVIDGGTY